MIFVIQMQKKKPKRNLQMINKITIVLILFLIACNSTGLKQEKPHQDSLVDISDQMDRGEKLVKENCSLCHAKNYEITASPLYLYCSDSTNNFYKVLYGGLKEHKKIKLDSIDLRMISIYVGRLQY